jgi:hypothetical protein
VNRIILSTVLTAMVALTVGCGRQDSTLDSTRDPAAFRHEAAWPQFRQQVDTARNRVWFLTRNEVHLFDLETPENIRRIELPGWIWVDEPYGCMPDLVLGPKGEALVTSNILPWLWRIDPDTFAVSKHELALDADTGKDVGFSGLTYSAEERAFFAVSYFHGSLWRIDSSLQNAQHIRLSAPIPQACGLDIRPRTSQQRITRAVGLCAGTGPDRWNIDLAPNQRSAFVSSRACT